ncbi:hypothetical protein Sxan_57480 [Streptomyces xanthophaeus]|uniref:Uncharacterized protein n=1 Tax=Streptomyces xanthophaeus TaxID=67385 RepID=A0A919LLA6_9ACTN|nr:hypothetical protein Sxan_57480 [Streptomyces xanthophaeus]
MPEPLESPAKILSPARPVDLVLLETGGAWSIWVGVVEAMVFPVWVGGQAPWRRCTGFPRVEGKGSRAGPLPPDGGWSGPARAQD